MNVFDTKHGTIAPVTFNDLPARVLVVAAEAAERALARERLADALGDVETVEHASVGRALAEVPPGSVRAVVASGLPSEAGGWHDLAHLADAQVAPLLLLLPQSVPALARRAVALGADEVADWDAFAGARARTALELCAERWCCRQALRRAERRASNLHAVCTGFAAMTTEAEVAGAALDGVLLFGAAAGAVMLREGDDLVLFRTRGYPPETTVRFARLAVAARDNPVAEAARTAKPVWVESHTGLVDRYGTDHNLAIAGARCALPLVAEQGAVGVLGVTFAPGCAPHRDDRVALESLAAACTQAMRRARAYDEMRERVSTEQRLLGMVAHELRNPLGVLTLSAEAVARGGIGHAAGFAERIKRATWQISRMVSDLVDYSASNLDVLGVRPAVHDFFAHLVTCVDDVRARAPSRLIALACAGEGEGVFDAGRFAQAVSNLLTNALAYGAADAPVEVRGEGVGDRIYVEVTNQGPVIAPEAMALLFEPAKRATTKGGRGHLGFGLFITKSIAEAHGGRVWVRSSAAAGTTFVLEFPRGGPPAGASSASRPCPLPPAKPREPSAVPEAYSALWGRFVDDALGAVLLRWLALAGDRQPPHPRLMGGASLMPYVPDITLVAVEPGEASGEPIFRHLEVGGALERRLGRGLAGRPITGVASGLPLDVDMRSAYRRCLLSRAPTYDCLRFYHAGARALFERLVVPCSHDGGATVTHLYAIVRFAERRDVAPPEVP